MKGHCLCGAVSVMAPDVTHIAACHCGICRRWGGGPYLGVHCGPEIQVEGAEHVTTFKSSEWAERAFCAKCGTHLYYHLIPGDDYAVTAGLFQDGPEFEFKEQIFIDKKPRAYDFANVTTNLTEAEVFAKYGAE
jgi:hypothetical protein